MEVAKAYPGKNWTQKVMQMSDAQVHDIFVSLQFKRENEAKRRAMHEAQEARKKEAGKG